MMRFKSIETAFLGVCALAVMMVAHGDLVEATFPEAAEASSENAASAASAPSAPIPPPPPPPTNPVPSVESKPAREAASSWWGWITGGEVEEKPVARAEDVERLAGEVSALRQEINQLSETLNLMVNRVMADLERENAQLRDELRKVYGSGAVPLPPQVPRPGGELLDQVLSEAPLDSKAPATAPTAPAAVSFGYTVLQEWGRSPEAAEELGGNATSLKGMVCVVPKGSSRADLEAMGRELRKKYDQFNNINIEVFDDEEAAKEYAEQNKMRSAHRVLSVSKHQASGRDVILYYEEGTTYEVGR